jgi:nicotinamidase/pyrazinamidase
MKEKAYAPAQGDALVAVDVQNDFLPGGSLAVPMGDQIVPLLNRYLELFHSRNLPVWATRDWHPPDHISFKAQGGPWPPHCVAGTEGAAFARGLKLSGNDEIISKADRADKDAYSGFEGTVLKEGLEKSGVRRIFVGGLATDYCVLNTVKDALKLGFEVVLLEDAIRAVNVNPEDGEKAVEEMVEKGARTADFEMVAL